MKPETQGLLLWAIVMAAVTVPIACYVITLPATFWQTIVMLGLWGIIVTLLTVLTLDDRDKKGDYND